MVQLFATLITLALAAAFNPAMFLTTLALLSASRPLARAGAFLLGAMLVCVVVGIVALLGFTDSGQVRHSGKASTLTTWAYLVVGIGLILFAAWTWVWRPAGVPKTPVPARQTRRLSGGPAIAFLLGAGIQLSNLKSLGIYLIGVHEIVAAAPGTLVTVIAMALFIVIMLSGVELPILLYLVVPDRADRLLTTIRLWLTTHARTLTIGIGLVAGAFLVLKGIFDLLA